jgi:hypothetical protein
MLINWVGWRASCRFERTKNIEQKRRKYFCLSTETSFILTRRKFRHKKYCQNVLCMTSCSDQSRYLHRPRGHAQAASTVVQTIDYISLFLPPVELKTRRFDEPADIYLWKIISRKLNRISSCSGSRRFSVPSYLYSYTCTICSPLDGACLHGMKLKYSAMI